MKHIITVLTLVLIAGISRLVPHPWNFTAVGAMALFAGSALGPKKQWAFLAPLLSLLWTDAVLGFHSTTFYVYMAVMLITIIGMFVESNKPAQIFAGALGGSVLFFAISNLGVWMSQGLYPMTWDGLVQCFVMAIPFFGNQVAGDLVFSGVLFGAYALIKSLKPSLVASN